MQELSDPSPLSSSESDVLAEFIGKDFAFTKTVGRIPSLARADGAVLISGETGTGKELFARAIHRLSARASSPFVPVNCGSLVDTLFQDELFGHERGAFTDARSRQEGLLAHAAGGTLFLDEIDTLAPRAQISLLRVIQDRSFRPLGTALEQRVDVRFVAATNAALDLLINAGTFRADLYYRLSVFQIMLPPLRDRREDILLLALHFLRKGASRTSRLSAGSEVALLAHDWPGNVRELENAIERGLSAAPGGVLEREDLGIPMPTTGAAPQTSSYKEQKRTVLEAFERDYLLRIMTEHRGNVSRAARAAGKERRDLGKLLKRYHLDPRQFAG